MDLIMEYSMDLLLLEQMDYPNGDGDGEEIEQHISHQSEQNAGERKKKENTKPPAWRNMHKLLNLFIVTVKL